MTIFNSLGSNYDLKFALGNLLSSGEKKSQTDLINLLEGRYNGKATLVYKGREAIRLALRASNLKGSVVAICGFTCYAVYEAVTKEGYGVEYLDIEKNSLNFSYLTLKKAIDKNPEIKVVMIQNTLGYPCDIEDIAKICKERSIILIEDLAHSIGAVYENGKEAGTVGDFVMLSFSQDKMVDNVSGGALIIRSTKYNNGDLGLKVMDIKQQIKDKIYPIITFKIRKTYSIGIGKFIHKLARSANILSKPMDYLDYGDIHSLPEDYCRVIYSQFISIDENLSHRRKITGVYKKTLDPKLVSQEICNEINNSSNLRFPIFSQNRDSLISYLKKSQIYISDVWYDAPIAPKKYMHLTDYKKGSCPNSENAADTILNLPTHRNVSENDARYISQKINTWMKSQ